MNDLEKTNTLLNRCERGEIDSVKLIKQILDKNAEESNVDGDRKGDLGFEIRCLVEDGIVDTSALDAFVKKHILRRIKDNELDAFKTAEYVVGGYGWAAVNIATREYGITDGHDDDEGWGPVHVGGV